MHVEALSKQYSMTEIYLYYFCVSIHIYMQSFIVSVYFKNWAMFYFLWGEKKVHWNLYCILYSRETCFVKNILDS